MTWFSRAKISPEVALRALAISLVTFNHAQQLHNLPMGFGGGMSFLMMLSGFNFAKFAMDGRTAAEVRGSIVRLALGVGAATYAVIAGSAVIRGEFAWSEWLLISNFVESGDVAMIFLWYPQVLLQMLAGLWVVFSLPAIGRAILKHPFWSSAAIFAGAVLIRIVFPWAEREHHMPHLFLWNFALGWLIYFTLNTDNISGFWPKRLVALAFTAAGAFAGWSWGVSNPYVMTAFTALFLFSRTFPAPAIVAWGVNLISQATFAIFLLHIVFMRLYSQFFEQDSVAKFLFSMTLCVVSWVLVASLGRAYATRRQALAPA